MNGWGVRPYNWEFSTSVQQQIAPRMSVNFGYFRRISGNFKCIDNEALGPNDFTQFSVKVPTTTGNGFALPNVRADDWRASTIRTASSLRRTSSRWRLISASSSSIGTASTSSVDARLRSGLFLQGGVGVGQDDDR